MVCRLITGFSLVSLCVFTLSATGTQVFADPGKTYVNARAQDEGRVLPEENAATFVASDRRIRLQLVRLAGSSEATFAGTPLTVIDPMGRSIDLTTDRNGVAILSDVTSGAHAIVSAGPHGHVAIPLVLREVPDDEDQAVDAGVVSNVPITTVALPLMNVTAGEVMRVANSFLPPPSAVTSSLADVDDQLVFEGQVVQSHRYRVRLEAGGRIEGRVVSLMLPDVPEASLGGMNLLVYSGNRLVARAITDEQGRFAFENLQPGIHGLIAAGPAGYAAFAFDVFGADELVRDVAEETLVSDSAAPKTLVRMNQPGANSLPVVVIPPPMVPAVVAAVRRGDQPPVDLVIDPAAPGFAPVPGGGAAGGGFGGGGGGMGAGAGGGGGIGGLLALGAIGAAIAAAARDSDGDRPIIFPPIATPAVPGPPAP